MLPTAFEHELRLPMRAGWWWLGCTLLAVPACAGPTEPASRCEDGAWAPIAPEPTLMELPISDPRVFPTDDGFVAVRGDVILDYDGTADAWSRLPSPPPGTVVWAGSDRDLFALGTISAPEATRILHRLGLDAAEPSWSVLRVLEPSEPGVFARQVMLDWVRDRLLVRGHGFGDLGPGPRVVTMALDRAGNEVPFPMPDPSRDTSHPFFLVGERYLAAWADDLLVVHDLDTSLEHTAAPAPIGAPIGATNTRLIGPHTTPGLVTSYDPTEESVMVVDLGAAPAATVGDWLVAIDDRAVWLASAVTGERRELPELGPRTGIPLGLATWGEELVVLEVSETSAGYRRTVCPE